QRKGWSIGSMLRLHPEEVCSRDILQYEGRPQVFLQVSYLDVAEMNILRMANEKAVAGQHRTEHHRLRIRVLLLWRPNLRIGRGSAALVLDVNIIQPNIFDFMTRNTADDRPKPGYCVRADDIADDHAAQLAYRHTLRAPHPASQPHKNWSVADVAHRDV